MIRAENLCKNFGTIEAVKNCTFQAEAGSFTVIVGKSGCGKTTLLNLLAGMEKPDRGSAVPADISQCGFMFQDPRLLPWLTVEGNLRLAFAASAVRDGTAADIIKKTLALVGLQGRERAKPGELSGGMAQRVSLARALCRVSGAERKTNGRCLLLDEPLSALDAFTRKRLRAELDRIWRDTGITIVLVTHDIEEAVYLGTRVLLMDSGAISGAVDIQLERKRDYHSAEFQEYCRLIEGRISRDE